MKEKRDHHSGAGIRGSLNGPYMQLHGPDESLASHERTSRVSVRACASRGPTLLSLPSSPLLIQSAQCLFPTRDMTLGFGFAHWRIRSLCLRILALSAFCDGCTVSVAFRALPRTPAPHKFRVQPSQLPNGICASVVHATFEVFEIVLVEVWSS